MLPSLNHDSKDPKFILLGKIFKIIDSKKFRNNCSRNGIKNRQMIINSIKILFISMYFNYTVSQVINELNHSRKLRKFAGFSNEISSSEQIYEYLSRYSADQYCKIVNTTFLSFNKESMENIIVLLLMLHPLLVISIMISISYQKNIWKN